MQYDKYEVIKDFIMSLLYSNLVGYASLEMILLLLFDRDMILSVRFNDLI